MTNRYLLPFKWAEKPAPKRWSSGVEKICKPLSRAGDGDIVAIMPEIRKANGGLYTAQVYYLIKATKDYLDLNYLALSEESRELVAFPSMEIMNEINFLMSIDRQMGSILSRSANNQSLHVVIFQNLIVAFDSAGLGQLQGQDCEYTQETLDTFCISLGLPVEAQSAHEKILLQSKMDACHNLFAKEFLPYIETVEPPKIHNFTF